MIFQKMSGALCFKYPSTHINNNYDDDYDDKGLGYSPLGLSCDYISNDKDNEIHTQLIIFPINLYGDVKFRSLFCMRESLCVLWLTVSLHYRYNNGPLRTNNDFIS